MYSKILFKFFVSFVSEEEEEEDDDDDDEGGATAFRLLFVGTKNPSRVCCVCVCRYK